MKFPNKGRSAAVAAIVLSATLALATPLSAEENIFNLNIDAQPLGSAITELSQATNVVIFVPSELIAGKSAPGIRGDMTFEVALNQLLEGTELQSQRDTSGAVYITGKENKKTTTNIKRESGPKELALEEMVVTAEKRKESTQNIPIAISAFSGESMENAGILEFGDLQRQATSLQIGKVGDEFYVTMRGIGSDLPNIGAEAGVTVNVDGVPLARNFLFDGDFMDVERVEVLRGPQGTINGRNATGGAINIYSKLPTEEFEGKIKTTIGNYNRFATEGYFSGPLLESNVLGRIAFATDNADGWLKNTLLNRHIENKKRVNLRGSLLADLSDNIEAVLIVDWLRDRSDNQSLFAFGRARSDEQSLGEFTGVMELDPERLEFEGDLANQGDKEKLAANLKLTWDISPATTLMSVTGYVTLDDRNAGDCDGTRLDVCGIPNLQIDIDQYTQEFTLTTDLTDRLDLILGGLYLQENTKEPLEFTSSEFLGLGPGIAVVVDHQDLISYSAYTQLRYQLTEALRISVGARYTYDQKDYQETGFGLVLAAAEDSWSAVTPRLAIDYSFSDNITLYANVARGFKAGGFNTFASPVNPFNPELVWSYEAGAKALFWDDRLRVSSAFFYMDYTDLQQNVFGLGADGFLPKVLNAGQAEIKGVEWEVEAQISEQFHFYLAGTWLDTQYTELHTADTIFPELGEPDLITGYNVRDLSGNRLPQAPEWQFVLSGEYTVPLTPALIGAFRADYSWRSDAFFTMYNHDQISQDAYGLLNVYVALEGPEGNWSLSAFANNLLDERYFSQFRSTTGQAPVPFRTGTLGTPRMYGLSLEYNF